jgi:hypothetical protein
MFYVEKLFIFLPRHFLQNSLFGFRQLPQLQNSTMVDLEGSPPPSAAASHRKVSNRHCGQVGCCFSLLIVLCLLCLLRFVFSFVSPSSLFALLTRSFFLSSLSFLLLVGCRLFLGSRPRGGSIPWLQSSAVLLLGPVPRPRRCSCSIPSSAAAVLLLGPFLGLGGAPARSLPRPWRSSALQPSLGAPPWRLAFASVLHTKPLASPRFSFLAPQACLGSPPRLQSSVP